MENIQLFPWKILLRICFDIGYIFGALDGLEGATAADYQKND
jgi:hypothetical protein